MALIKGVLQYHTVAVSGSLAENLTNALSGLGERKRKIERIWFCPDFASAPTINLQVVAKVQQTEVLRFDHSNFQDLDSDTKQYLSVDRSLPMDLVLDEGQAFNVGFYKSGATPGGTVSFAYRDLE